MQTYSRPGPSDRRLWQCPECGRVERTALRKPKCDGTPECPHSRSATQPLAESAGIGPGDDRRLFR